VGSVTEAISQNLKSTASGHAQYYGLMMAAGVLLAIAIAVFSH
jgi:prolipoprotein diacylglyceryltransferase